MSSDPLDRLPWTTEVPTEPGVFACRVPGKEGAWLVTLLPGLTVRSEGSVPTRRQGLDVYLSIGPLEWCRVPERSESWILWREDASAQPEIFSGEGAEEAAQAAFESARQHWTCRLFREVAHG